MRATELLVLLLLYIFSLDVSAGAVIYRRGTILSLDLEKNTILVIDKETGAISEYKLPKHIAVFNERVHRNDPSLLEPGQEVSLKFKLEEPRAREIFPDSDSDNFNLAGKVIYIDRSTGKGTLRESRTNRIVPFRFAEDNQNIKIPRPGDPVVFTATRGGSGTTIEKEQMAGAIGTDEVSDQPQGIPDRQDDGVLTDIEVTSSMVEAGLDAFYNRDSGVDTVQEIVTRIYRAMASASRN